MSRSIQLLIVGVWIGLVMGLSFIEAPLKFQAPGITTELGLGIGRLVFGALNKIELLFSTILLVMAFREWGGWASVLKISVSLVIAIVLIQSVILLPILNARVAAILAGQEVPSSWHHLGFIALEVIKLVTLFMLFFQFSKKEE